MMFLLNAICNGIFYAVNNLCQRVDINSFWFVHLMQRIFLNPFLEYLGKWPIMFGIPQRDFRNFADHFTILNSNPVLAIKFLRSAFSCRFLVLFEAILVIKVRKLKLRWLWNCAFSFSFFKLFDCQRPTLGNFSEDNPSHLMLIIFLISNLTRSSPRATYEVGSQSHVGYLARFETGTLLSRHLPAQS